MSRVKTADESRLECIAIMGEPLGELHHYLWQELVWLYSKWYEFEILFWQKPSRIDLMNEAAPYFFYIIQTVLMEDIILGIARITDRPKIAGKETLTIRRIPQLLDGHQQLNEEISSLVSIARDKTLFCRDWRNRRIAHRDLLLTTKKETKELASASYAQIKDALKSIANILNLISHYFLDSTTAFEIKASEPGNSESLLYVIHDGLKAYKEREDRIDKGKEKPDDFEVPEI